MQIGLNLINTEGNTFTCINQILIHFHHLIGYRYTEYRFMYRLILSFPNLR